MPLPKKIEVKAITRLITALMVAVTIGAIVGTGLYIAGVTERVSAPNQVSVTTKGKSPTVIVLDNALLKKIQGELNGRIDQPLPDDTNLKNPFLPLEIETPSAPPQPPTNEPTPPATPASANATE